MHSVFLPYSSVYSTFISSRGSLPGLRIGTNPNFNSVAIGQPKRNPLDSGPTIFVAFLVLTYFAKSLQAS